MSFTSDNPIQAVQLPIDLDLPDEFPLFKSSVESNFKRTNDALNIREGAFFPLKETATFQSYFKYSVPASFTPDPNNFRSTYRKTFDMVAENSGNITAGTTVSVAHNIDSILYPTRIYGAAKTTGGDFLPLPYSSETTTKNIEIYLTSSNIVLINGSTQSTLEYATIVAEYLKSD